jgi:Sugar-transfer associated ATP-grasp
LYAQGSVNAFPSIYAIAVIGKRNRLHVEAGNFEMNAAAGILRRPLGASAVDIAKPLSSSESGAVLSRIAAAGKRSYVGMLAEATRLRFAAGCLSLDEYVQLRLFDDDLYKGANKRAFVGVKAAGKIWFRANYRVDLFALANNKIACDIWFVTHGIPVLPTVAIFHEAVGRPGPFLLRSDSELRAFLRKTENYPLFGKPIDGYQSIGSASVERYDAARDCLVMTMGRRVTLDGFVHYVKAHAATGYQFQPRVSPHAAVREICGDRLATVRLLTILKDGKPRLLRACWKIPAGDHAADNFWRPGNLLAQLDLESGRALRVIRQSASGYDEITHHPDTGVPIKGAVVPNWKEVTQLACESATLLGELPLIGWDIAPVYSGAVLVEANVSPDFQLHQIADRCGILDPVFTSFLKRRKRDRADAVRAAKKARRLSRASSRAGLARAVTRLIHREVGIERQKQRAARELSESH